MSKATFTARALLKGEWTTKMAGLSRALSTLFLRWGLLLTPPHVRGLLELPAIISKWLYSITVRMTITEKRKESENEKENKNKSESENGNGKAMEVKFTTTRFCEDKPLRREEWSPLVSSLDGINIHDLAVGWECSVDSWTSIDANGTGHVRFSFPVTVFAPSYDGQPRHAIVSARLAQS